MTHNTLHVIGARCVARDFHTIVPWPLERTCWRQFAAQRENCKQSRTAPLNAIINIIISLLLIILLLTYGLLTLSFLARASLHRAQFETGHPAVNRNISQVAPFLL